MYTQTLIPREESLILPVPKALVGHRLRVTIDDLGESRETAPHNGESNSLDDLLRKFSATRLDTYGFRFDRDEANRR